MVRRVERSVDSKEMIAARPAPPRLDVRAVSKSFGASRALIDVSLSVAAGEVHALVGENGCGKSTLVKILAGFHAPDPGGGAVLVDGEPLQLPITPRGMRRGGLAVVHQDLGLLDAFSVAENIRLGDLSARRITRAVAWRRERERAAAALAALGARIDPAARVGSLSVFERTEVAIARALQRLPPGRGLVVLDEATRALPAGPRAHLHRLSAQIAAAGGSVLLISHQLDEALRHADRVSVMRDGRVRLAGVAASELTEAELVKAMLSREPKARSRARSRGAAAGADLQPGAGVPAAAAAVPPADAVPPGAGIVKSVARVHSLHGATLRGISLSVAAGEILGVTGLLGSGAEELPYLLGGARRARGGTLTIGGREHELTRAPLRALLAAGVALVPERRERDGLALERTVQENVTLPRVSARGRRSRIGRDWQRAEADWVIETLGVRPAEPRATVGALSGGNRQKVLIGKWLCARPRLLIAHEVTQGVDVGARMEIEQALALAAAGGCAVILASMDAGELAGLCDRILVIDQGRIARELGGGQRDAREIAAAVHGEPAGSLA